MPTQQPQPLFDAAAALPAAAAPAPAPAPAAPPTRHPGAGMPGWRSVLNIPGRLDPATRASLPNPKVEIGALHAALSEYRAAKIAEKEAAARAKRAEAMLLPIARQAFSQQWLMRGERPEPPVLLANHAGEELGYVVTKPNRGELSEKAAESLRHVAGDDLYGELVIHRKALQFDDDMLATPRIRSMLLNCVAASDLSLQEQAQLVRSIERRSLRNSPDESLARLAERGWPTLMRGLEALQSVFRQYFQV